MPKSNKPEPSNLLKSLIKRIDSEPKQAELPPNKLVLPDNKIKTPLINKLINRIEPSKKDVLAKNPFKDIEALRREINPKNQFTFYQQQIKKIKGEVTAPKLLNTSATKKTISFGSMFLFNYDAKLKDELPYWDAYPLVIPFDVAKGGFLGLNLHYLPIYLRIRFLEKLYDFQADETLTDDARLEFSWSMTKGISGLKEAEPCVKHYLSNHVTSRFMLVKPQDWKAICFLPLQQFKKASAGKVWQDSLMKMRK